MSPCAICAIAVPASPWTSRSPSWDRFYRVSGVSLALSTNTAPEYGSGIGLGLGLYIAREIVACHGGAVALASASGEGATFAFTLSLAAASDASSET